MNLSGRQREIVDAALEILATDGVDALTVKHIAAHVGFKDAAIYRHFKSKADILAAIVDLFAVNAQHDTNHLLANSLGSLEQIRLFFMNRCHTFASNMAVTTVMFSDDAFKQSSVLAGRIGKAMQEHHAILLNAIVVGQQRHEIVDLDPEHLFLLVMGSLRLLVTQWRVANQSFDLLREGERLWNSLEKILSDCSLRRIQ